MTSAAPLFQVTRRCSASGLVCEAGCNCHLVTVAVDVDELTELEIEAFQTSGTDAQKAELAAWLGDDNEVGELLAA